MAWGGLFILISTLLQSADGKLSMCQSHKLTHPSRHYLIIMISHKCLIVMTSRHQIHGLAFFFDYITLGPLMPRPLSLKSQGQNADCEAGSSLESNYQFYYWGESVWFGHCCPVRGACSRSEIMVLASQVITYSMDICQNPSLHE